MKYYHHPGSGNGQQHGQGGGHRHGQSQLHHPNNGLHGGFHYNGDMNQPTAHVSQTGSSMLPAVIPHQSNALLPAPQEQPKKGFSLANLANMANFNEIKGFVDRMGGLDGILSTVTKVQKVVGSVTQMAPLVKVLFGSFKKSDSESDNGNLSRPRRRKRRRPGTSSGRPRSGSSSRPRNRPRRRR